MGPVGRSPETHPIRCSTMDGLLSAGAVRVGAVRGRYFRENFAQGGIDLVQIVPELVTNADAAIAAGGCASGRIEVRFGPPDASFLDAWRAQMLRCGSPLCSPGTSR